MTVSMPWIILVPALDLTDAPQPETQAEAILLWVSISLASAVVAMFWWMNRVHAGHKETIRKQGEDHALTIRTQEQAYTQALRDQAERDRAHGEQVSERLFGILENATVSREKNTAAIEALSAEILRERNR